MYQGHLSIVKDIHLDFHANLKPMTVGMTLAFLCFFCFVCNGTTVLAEIHRGVSEDTKYWRKVLDKVDGDMWVFFKFANKKFIPGKKIGSCSDFRYKYHIQDNNWMEWNTRVEDLFRLCQTFKDLQSGPKKMTESKLRNLCHNFIHHIKTKKHPTTKEVYYKGAGHLGAVQFLQLAGMLGLVPLYCATYAEVDNGAKRGPSGWIKRAINENPDTNLEEGEKVEKKIPIPEVFFKMQNDIVKIWGSLITLALLENLLCECYRSFKRTCNKHKMNKNSTSISVIEDLDFLVDSKFVDISFWNERRRCVQNFYNVRLSGSGADKLRPAMFMKVSHLSSQENKTICLTNWCGNKKDRKMLYWEKMGSERTLDTKLCMDSELRSYFIHK